MLFLHTTVTFLHTVNGYFYDDPGTGYNTAGTKGEGIAATIANEPDGRGMLANGGGGGDNANSWRSGRRQLRRGCMPAERG